MFTEEKETLKDSTPEHARPEACALVVVGIQHDGKEGHGQRTAELRELPLAQVLQTTPKTTHRIQNKKLSKDKAKRDKGIGDKSIR
jgi:hypothetical protein